MLIDSLFTIKEIKIAEESILSIVSVDAGHKIFEGHFPGQPVLPGVCQIQLIKELLEKNLSKKLLLTNAANCKFLQMVIPHLHPLLEVKIDYKLSDQTISANAVIKNAETAFLKLNATFLIEETS